MPDLSLDLRYLRYALAVAEQGSFRRAAAKLDVSQSTISRRIKLLEFHIGVVVFHRDHRGVRVTSAGQKFLDEAMVGARHFSNAVNAMKAIRYGRSGELRVGLFASLSPGFVRSLIQQYRDRHISVDIRLEESTAQTSLGAILDGRLDLVFVTGEPNLPRCDTLKLWDERLFVALFEDHPFAGMSSISWDMLRDERFIVTSGGRGPEIEDYLIARLSRPGFHPDVHTHSVARETLINMVALRFGAALVTESAIGAEVAGVVFRPLAEAAIIPASAVWLTSNPNPALKPLLRLARSMAQRDGVI